MPTSNANTDELDDFEAAYQAFLPTYDAYEQNREAESQRSLPGHIAEAGARVASGAAGTAGSMLTGAQIALDRVQEDITREEQPAPQEGWLGRAGEALKTAVPTDPNYDSSDVQQVAQGVGSLGASLIAGGAGGKLVGGALFGATGIDTAYQEIRDFTRNNPEKAAELGMDEKWAQSFATRYGFLPGVAEMIGVEAILRKVPVKFRKEGSAYFMRRVAESYGAEWTSENMTQVLQNDLRRMYDDDHELLAGAPEAGNQAGWGAAALQAILYPLMKRGPKAHVNRQDEPGATGQDNSTDPDNGPDSPEQFLARMDAALPPLEGEYIPAAQEGEYQQAQGQNTYSPVMDGIETSFDGQIQRPELPPPQIPDQRPSEAMAGLISSAREVAAEQGGDELDQIVSAAQITAAAVPEAIRPTLKQRREQYLAQKQADIDAKELKSAKNAKLVPELPVLDSPLVAETALPIQNQPIQRPKWADINAEDDDMLTAIAKAGGLNSSEGEAQGFDPANFSIRKVGLQPVFRKNGGKSFDEMAETLSQYGYPVHDEAGGYGANALLSSLDRALRGDDIRTPQGHFKQAAKLQAEQEQERQQARDRLIKSALDGEELSVDQIRSLPRYDAAEYGGEYSHEEMAIIDQMADALDNGATPESILSSVREGGTWAAQVGRLWATRGQNSEQNTGRVIESSDESVPFPEIGQTNADESAFGPKSEFGLKQESEADRESRERQAREKLEAQEAEGKKAEIQKEANDFILTGSDSSVDAAEARGQNNLFDANQLKADANQASTSAANDLPEPTDAQKEAGNYKMGHTKIHGMPITIEYPQGSSRTGTAPDGRKWSREMKSHYGYIKRTTGADGEHVDVFIGDKPDSTRVFIVDQVDKDGKFDEHKVLLGYSNRVDALRGYKQNYPKGFNVGPVSEMSVDDFKEWLKTSPTKPASNELEKPEQENQRNEERATATEAENDTDKTGENKPTLKQARMIKLVGNVGDTVIPSQDVDYLKKGVPVEIKGISKSGEVQFASEAGETNVQFSILNGAIRNGAKFELVMGSNPEHSIFTKEGITVSIPVIEKRVIDDYNRTTHIGKGRDFNAELKESAASIIDDLAERKHTLTTDEQKQKAVELIESYLEDSADFIRWQSAQSTNNPSWAVTGRSNRDMAKYSARNEKHMDAFTQRVDKLESQRKRIAERLYDMRPQEVKDKQALNQDHKEIARLVAAITEYMRDGRKELEKETRKWASPKAHKLIESAHAANPDETVEFIKKMDAQLKDDGGLQKVVGPISKAGRLIKQLMDETKAEPSKPAQAATKAEPESHVQRNDAFWDRVNHADESLTASDVLSFYDAMVDNEAAVIAELSKLTKAQLQKHYRGYNFNYLKKAELVEDVYEGFVTSLGFLTSKSGVMSLSAIGKKPRFEAVRKKLEALTNEQLQEVIKARNAERNEFQEKRKKTIEGIKDPKTLEDFRNAVRTGASKDFTPEQWATYDRLHADDRIEKRVESQVKTVSSVGGEVNYTLHESVHSKKGHELFIVSLNDRVERDLYTELNTKAKQLGGYYSNFNKAGAIPGFQFKTEEARNDFLKVLGGESVEKAKTYKDQTDSLLELAERMEARAEETLGRDRKTNTHKRASEAAGAIARAETELASAAELKVVAQAIKDGKAKYLSRMTAGTEREAIASEWNSLRHLAGYNEEGKALLEKHVEGGEARGMKWKADVTPEQKVRFAEYPLTRISADSLHRISQDMVQTKGYKQAGMKFASESKNQKGKVLVGNSKHFNKLLDFILKHQSSSYLEDVARDYNRLQKMGIETLPMLRAALLEYNQITGKAQAKKVENAVSEKLKYSKLMGKYKDNDFFNTTAEPAKMAVELADLEEGMTVFEPSAGAGHLADAVAEIVGKENVTVNELANELHEILKDKGYQGTQGDFLSMEPKQGSSSGFDRIVMNPPFSKDQEITHIEHAYKFLKPGGRLVAITSSMAGNRSNKRNQAFREWLEELSADEHALPDGSFKDAINPTMVSSKIIVIDKPEATDSAEDSRFSRKADQGSANVQSVIDRITKAWKNAPKIHVVDGLKGLPEALQKHIKAQGAESDVRAVYWKDQVYMIAGRFRTEIEAEEALLHEVIGHFGLRKLMGSDIKPYLNRVYMAMAGTQEAKAIIKAYFTAEAFDPTNVNHRLLVAEELIAHLAESGKHQSLFAKFLKAVNDWLRAAGFSIQFGKYDLLATLRQAEQVVANGGVDQMGSPLLDLDRAMFHRAWHGSPSKFDKFEKGKTDSSLNAFGDGLYFTDSKEIAELYRDVKGSDGALYQVDLKPSEAEYLLWDSEQQSPFVQEILDELSLTGTGEQAYKKLAKSLGGMKAASDFLRMMGIRGNKFFAEGSREGESLSYKGKRLPAEDQMTPEQLAAAYVAKYDRDAKAMLEYGGHKEAIKLLPSIQKDDISEQPDYNYVVFDESDIEIEARFKRIPQTDSVIGEENETETISNSGQYVDRIFRAPFEMAGLLDEHGRLKIGVKAADQFKKLLVEWKPPAEWGWLSHWVEMARAGLIDRYKLTDEYKELWGEAEAYKLTKLRELKDIISTIKGMTEAEEKTLRSLILGEEVDDKTWSTLSEPIRRSIDDMGKTMVDLGLIAAESYERNKGKYLHRSYLKHEAEFTPLGRFLHSVRTGNARKIRGGETKSRGIDRMVDFDRLMRDVPAGWFGLKRRQNKADHEFLKEKEFTIFQEHTGQGTGTESLDGMGEGGSKKKRAGRIVYWPADKPAPAKYEAWDNLGTWKVIQTSGQKVKLWRDYTEAEREAMGEILNVKYNLAKTFQLLSHDIAMGSFFNGIAKNDEWFSMEMPDHGYAIDADKARTLSAIADADWVKVPEGRISDSVAKRYGAMAGGYVRAEIWRDIQELDRMHNPTTWSKFLTQWKLNKALSLNTEIPTVNGWTTMGDIQVGDQLFDENGAVCSVLEVKEIQHNNKCYKVVFSDGAEIVADAGHLWFTTADGVGSVKTTEEIKGTLRKNRGDARHSIPVAKPLELPRQNLIMPPYALGVWLGDGNSNNAQIHIGGDDLAEIIQHIEDAGLKCGTPRKDKRNNVYAVTMMRSDENTCMRGHDRKYTIEKGCYKCSNAIKWAKQSGGTEPKVTNGRIGWRLDDLGLRGNKHVPLVYLRASVAQRMELLQGLMDSDGCVTTAGDCVFVNSNKKLIDGVVELLHSLGYKPTIRRTVPTIDGRSCNESWRVTFTGYKTDPICKLKRKAERLRDNKQTNPRSQSRQIVDVVPVESEPVRCIAVSSESNLFLAGREMIPTHNTARNPVVHMNNVLSNIIFMDLADVRYRDLKRGIMSVFKTDNHFLDAEKHGAFGGTFIEAEVQKDIMRPILEELVAKMNTDEGFVSKLSFLSSMTRILYSKLEKLDDGMQHIYQIEDMVFRMATYMRRVELGDSPKEAALFAKEQFLDYDIRAPIINTLRRSVFPFISYTYRAGPVIAKAVMHRPWKLAKYYTIAYIANALAYALVPGDEEEERRSMRDQEQGNTWIGVPRMMRMPRRDDNGNPVFLDIRRYIPGGDFFDTNQGQNVVPIPAPFNLSGPLMIGFELALNKSAFTGKEIVNKHTDTVPERFQKAAKYAYQSWMPSAAYVPGGHYWDKIGGAISGERDALGRPYSVGQAIASSLGVKFSPQDVKLNLQWRTRDLLRVRQDLKSQARQTELDFRRNMISQEQRDDNVNGIIEKLKTLEERYGELMGK